VRTLEEIFGRSQALDDHAVLASVGSVGDAHDNALAEPFVDSFKTELIADRTWVLAPHRGDRREGSVERERRGPRSRDPGPAFRNFP
jgi:transposase InsO family protein